MNYVTSTIQDLLVEYRRLNEEMLRKIQLDMMISVEEFELQSVTPPESGVCVDVPTFERGCNRRLTKMLKDRFAYAGSWSMAEAGITWLSLKEIAVETNSFHNIDLVRNATTVWEYSEMYGIPMSRVSLYGIHPTQGEAIYLVWSDTDGVEPEIVSCSGGAENRHPDLKHYLQSLVDGAEMALRK